MLHNYTFDLLNQLNQESKSLWRIRNEYIKNAAGKDDLLEFWKKLQADKEEHIEELKILVGKNL